MHDWNDGGGWGGGGSIAMMVIMAVFVVVAVWAVVTLVRHGTPRRFADPDPPDATPGAWRILDERFARGEIDDDEYSRRRAALQAHRA